MSRHGPPRLGAAAAARLQPADVLARRRVTTRSSDAGDDRARAADLRPRGAGRAGPGARLRLGGRAGSRGRATSRSGSPHLLADRARAQREQLHRGTAPRRPGPGRRAGRRGHRRRLHLPRHRARGPLHRRRAGLRRRPPGHLDDRPGRGRGRDHRRAPSASSRSTRSACRPTTTSSRAIAAGTACGWSRTLPARPARRTGAARPADWPTPRASPSTAARASPPARAARITSDNAELMAKARKLHFFGVESAFDRAGSGDLPVPVFDEIGWNYKMSEIAAAVVSVAARPAAGPGRRAAPSRCSATPSCSEDVDAIAGAHRAARPRDGVAVLRPDAGARRRPRPVAVELRGAGDPVQHRHLRLARAAGLRRAASTARSRPTSSGATWRSPCTPT